MVAFPERGKGKATHNGCFPRESVLRGLSYNNPVLWQHERIPLSLIVTY
jgi:hypothetical protein